MQPCFLPRTYKHNTLPLLGWGHKDFLLEFMCLDAVPRDTRFVFITAEWLASQCHCDAQFDLLTYWHEQYKNMPATVPLEPQPARAYRRVNLDEKYRSRPEHCYTKTGHKKQKVAHEGDSFAPTLYAEELVKVLIHAANNGVGGFVMLSYFCKPLTTEYMQGAFMFAISVAFAQHIKHTLHPLMKEAYKNKECQVDGFPCFMKALFHVLKAEGSVPLPTAELGFCRLLPSLGSVLVLNENAQSKLMVPLVAQFIHEIGMWNRQWVCSGFLSLYSNYGIGPALYRLTGASIKICLIHIEPPGGNPVELLWSTFVDMDTLGVKPADPEAISHEIVVDNCTRITWGLQTPDVFDTFSGEPMTKQKKTQRRRNFARYRQGRCFTDIRHQARKLSYMGSKRVSVLIKSPSCSRRWFWLEGRSCHSNRSLFSLLFSLEGRSCQIDRSLIFCFFLFWLFCFSYLLAPH
jgi:hypothetical protein